MLRKYEKFDLDDIAQKGLNYITSMVDEKHDYLPYWRIQVNAIPANAMHTKVDDSELVASWYEAIVATEKIVGATEKSKTVKEAFKRHLLKSWGPKGFRYHEKYPWSHAVHTSFHEMGWVLSGMNRLLLEEPDNKDAEQKIANLVRGMRDIVFHRKIRTFWGGEFPFDEKVYEFPSDVYMLDGGFVPERVAGRGEPSIRNAVVLEPLVRRAQLYGDQVALDLAEGIANHMLGLSRYFNWKGEFFGHVHSTIWFAIGLIKLGRLMNKPFYIEKSIQIFEYVKSLSSEFGWVPEYAQWFPMSETDCETCCIKDMIEFALEAVELGYDYWDLIHKYTRNQLSEQQIKDGSFITVDNTKPDEDPYTWKDMDKRVVGGWSGGAEPNSMSTARFRSIAGCCVGTAPVALWMVWNKTIEHKPEGTYINFPIERENDAAKVEIGYPNEGFVKVTVKKGGPFYIRLYEWMGLQPELKINDRSVAAIRKNNCIYFENVQKGDVLTISHTLIEIVKEENVRGIDLRVFWRGPDVVKIDPPGLPLRMYQREEGVAKQYPKPIGTNVLPSAIKPTEQKK